MAAAIGELSEPSLLHGMIATPALQQHYQTATRPRDPQRQPSGSISRRYREDASSIPRNQKQWEPPIITPQTSNQATTTTTPTTTADPSTSQRPARLPSPPSSDGQDTPQTSPPARSKHVGRMEPNQPDATFASQPASADHQQESASHDLPPPAPRVIKIRDLAHIQSLAQAECVRNTGTGILDEQPSTSVRYEISDMPIPDVIEMVAGLLNKITLANDLTHDAKQRNVAHQQQAMADSNSGPVSTSILAFHGKNVPAISIHSYLSRIHKYCPTTFEVFLSLLVYFDRMTKRINETETQGRDREPSWTYMVLDAFNLHRLTIAGVTCASKFFSDVFYTNSRYAKVGGLPLFELNHLEIQFLVLNDFRLHIDVETLESYATMLVEFYARECVASRNGPATAE